MVYEILDILTQILGSYKQYSGSEYYFSCAFCHHYKQKLAVNLDKKKWQCWKCGAKGNTILSLLRKLDVSPTQIRQLATLLSDELPQIKLETEPEPTLNLPEEFRPLWNKSYWQCRHYQAAVTYLRDRGVALADVMRYNIGYCAKGMYAGRIIVPSYDAEARLNYFVGRTFWTGKLNYMNPHVSKNVIGFENLINWQHPIVLTEGVFDAMAVKRNAIPLLGKTLSKKLQAKIMAEGVKEIYLALDDDALKQTLVIAEKFMRENITVYLVEMSGKDPSQMGFVEVRHKMYSARKLTFSDLIQLRLSLV